MREDFAQLETAFFRTLNLVAEPLIRAGFGNPLLWPAGTIVIETTGRKTGRTISLPVLALRLGDMVVFGTVRRRSQWVRNLAARPQVRYWLGGRAREARAYVFTQASDQAPDQLPAGARCLARWLAQQSRLSGMSLALLLPRDQ